MNKNTENIDFLAQWHKYKDFDPNLTDNEIRDHLRFWLMYELYRHYGSSREDEMAEAYKWIWNSPVIEWNPMVVCLTRSTCRTLREVKELYGFLR